MSYFHPADVTGRTRLALKEWLEDQESVFSVEVDGFSPLLICYSLWRELGGPNDELSRFVTKRDLKGEIGYRNGESSPCFRLSSADGSPISLLSPMLSEMMDCEESGIFISPSAIATKIKAQGLQPVIVRDWLKRALFSDFDPKVTSYRDQLWVLRGNEVLFYSQLVAEGKIIFQDMHDITAHIAGIQTDGYAFAGRVAAQACQKLHRYFGPSGRGNLPSHLLPFLIGIILDGLTQSLIYGSSDRKIAIEELLLALDQLGIDPQSRLRLRGFPKAIDRINGSLLDESKFSVEALRTEIRGLVAEVRDLCEPVKSLSAVNYF